MKNSFHTWAHNQDRLSLLDPNQGEVRIYDWSFPMPIQTVRLGTAQKLACCAQPIVDVKRYTGRVPPNYREGESFDLSITLEGAAKLQRG